MCSSDKQNMDDIKIENLAFVFFSWIREESENIIRVLKTMAKESKDRTELKKKRTELKELVKKARGFIDNGKCHDSTFIGKLIDAEICGDAIDYLFHNNLIRDPVVNEIENLYPLLKELDVLISEQSTNQSSDPELGNVSRCLLLLPYFDKDFVFNLKRVTRHSVPDKVVPTNLEDLQSFLLNANGWKEIQRFPEWDNFSRIRCLKLIEDKQKEDSKSFSDYPIFEVVTNITDLPKFEELKFMLLRYLSLRNLEVGQNLDLNKLSSLKYLDLKHTNVENCTLIKNLEKLQMLDLRYTNVKEISGKDLEKLEELQHLLLGYIDQSKEKCKNQLVGPKLIEIKKLKKRHLKTLRAIELQPGKIDEISHVSDVVDLSVTGLTKDSLPTFWSILENFEKLTSLGVAVTHPTVNTLPDCKDKLRKLKENLKRLRMEGSRLGLEIGQFGKLNDLTLANMGIGSIPDLPELLCLRLYGVCQVATCEIELQVFRKLKKLVIGDMGKVETVKISSAVLGTVVTLKFSNLPKLKEVAYTDKQPSDEPHSFLRWEKSNAQVCPKTVEPNKTVFLRCSGDLCVGNSPGLKIYKYDMEKQCYVEVKGNLKQ